MRHGRVKEVIMNYWIISDTHWGHAKILTFEENGKPVRVFSSVKEMDETIVNNWNKVVKPEDVVYHLGDVVIGTGDNANYISILNRCNGIKELVKGNHDALPDTVYSQYFRKIHSMIILQKKRGLIMTHIPIHNDCVERFRINLHGHIHSNKIKDNRYVNCCVDFPGNTYTPLNLEDIRDGHKSTY